MRACSLCGSQDSYRAAVHQKGLKIVGNVCDSCFDERKGSNVQPQEIPDGEIYFWAFVPGGVWTANISKVDRVFLALVEVE